MNSKKKESLERKFQLKAEEIDRVMDELTGMLAEEPIDRNNAKMARGGMQPRVCYMRGKESG